MNTWKIYSSELTDGSFVFDVIGETKEGKITIRALSQEHAERIADELKDIGVEISFKAVVP